MADTIGGAIMAEFIVPASDCGVGTIPQLYNRVTNNTENIKGTVRR